MKERMKKRFNKDGNGVQLLIQPQLPGSLNIELTSACNHNCVFCPYHSWMLPEDERRSSHTMDYETVDMLLLKAVEEGIGEAEVGFHMTGESVLHKDFTKCVKRAKELGFQYVFTTTNGVYMTPDRFVESAEAGLDSLRFSINGYDRESYESVHGKDDFDIVMKNLNFMSEYKKKHNLKMVTSISVVLTKKTFKYKEKFENLLEGLADELVFIPVLSLERISEKAQDIYGFNSNGEYEYTPCPTVFNSMYISSEGFVVPCCSTTKIDGMILGNIHEAVSLKEIWLNKAFCNLRKNFIEGNIPQEWCKGCALINKKQQMIME